MVGQHSVHDGTYTARQAEPQVELVVLDVWRTRGQVSGAPLQPRNARAVQRRRARGRRLTRRWLLGLRGVGKVQLRSEYEGHKEKTQQGAASAVAILSAGSKRARVNHSLHDWGGGQSKPLP